MARIGEIVESQGENEDVPRVEVDRDVIAKMFSDYIKHYRKREKESGKLLIEYVKEDYGLDERNFTSILSRIDSAAFFPNSPPEVTRHTLLVGPPGTGKSFLVMLVGRKLSIPVLSLSPSLLSDPNAVFSVFSKAREIRRASLGVALKEMYNGDMSIFTGEFIGRISEKHKLDITQKERIKSLLLKKDIFAVMQPLEEGEAILLTEFSNELSHILSNETHENYVLSLLNVLLPGLPVFIWADEVDAVGSRMVHSNAGLNSLLQEIDGGSSVALNNGIAVFAATNKLNLLDSALVRSGRLKVVSIPYPDKRTRKKITEVMINRFVHHNIDFEPREEIESIISSIPLMTGSDIKELLDSVVSEERYGVGGSEKTDITPSVVGGVLSKKSKDSKLVDPAVVVKGIGNVVRAVVGGEVEEPSLKVALISLEEEKNSLLPEVVEEIRESSDYFQRAPESTVVEEARRRLESLTPLLDALKDVDTLIYDAYLSGKGLALYTNNKFLVDSIVDVAMHRSLPMSSHESVDPLLTVEVSMDSLLVGIVGATPNLIKDTLGKLKTMPPSIVRLKNVEVLFGTGQYNLEHVSVLIESLLEVMEKGHIVIYGGQVHMDQLENSFKLLPLCSTSEIQVFQRIATGVNDRGVLSEALSFALKMESKGDLIPVSEVISNNKVKTVFNEEHSLYQDFMENKMFIKSKAQKARERLSKLANVKGV